MKEMEVDCCVSLDKRYAQKKSERKEKKNMTLATRLRSSDRLVSDPPHRNTHTHADTSSNSPNRLDAVLVSE